MNLNIAGDVQSTRALTIGSLAIKNTGVGKVSLSLAATNLTLGNHNVGGV